MVYGPRNPAEGAYAIVTGKFIHRDIEGKPLIIEGTGQQFRDFVHVKDVARACILGLQSSVHGTVVNVGTGVTFSIKQVADLVSTNQERAPARKNDLVGTLADTCRAKRLLRFQARYDFSQTIHEIVTDAKSGAADYLEAMWKNNLVVSELETRLPGWTGTGIMERNALIRSALRKDPNFLAVVLDKSA